jgi:hypothetical protein
LTEHSLSSAAWASVISLRACSLIAAVLAGREAYFDSGLAQMVGHSACVDAFLGVAPE